MKLTLFPKLLIMCGLLCGSLAFASYGEVVVHGEEGCEEPEPAVIVVEEGCTDPFFQDIAHKQTAVDPVDVVATVPDPVDIVTPTPDNVVQPTTPTPIVETKKENTVAKSAPAPLVLEAPTSAPDPVVEEKYVDPYRSNITITKVKKPSAPMALRYLDTPEPTQVVKAEVVAEHAAAPDTVVSSEKSGLFKYIKELFLLAGLVGVVILDVVYMFLDVNL